MARERKALNLNSDKAQDKLCIDLINKLADKWNKDFTETARLLIETGAKVLEKSKQ